MSSQTKIEKEKQRRISKTGRWHKMSYKDLPVLRDDEAFVDEEFGDVDLDLFHEGINTGVVLKGRSI